MSAVAARALGHALRGEGAHVEVSAALDGMDWRLAGARVPGAPHTIFQLLNHMIYWQDVFLQRMTGGYAPSPAHAAEGWPGAAAPANEAEWDGAVVRFNQALAAVQSLISVDTLDDVLPKWNHRTRHEAMTMTAGHNSYHLGQIVLLRRILAAWPPPTGGDSW
jgi:uncharacterized damage-inducible protein DinB